MSLKQLTKDPPFCDSRRSVRVALRWRGGVSPTAAGFAFCVRSLPSQAVVGAVECGNPPVVGGIPKGCGTRGKPAAAFHSFHQPVISQLSGGVRLNPAAPSATPASPRATTPPWLAHLLSDAVSLIRRLVAPETPSGCRLEELLRLGQRLQLSKASCSPAPVQPFAACPRPSTTRAKPHGGGSSDTG